MFVYIVNIFSTRLNSYAFYVFVVLLPIVACERSTLPEVITRSVFDVELTSFTALGEVINDGGEPIIARGFVYSTRPDPTLIDFYTNEGVGDGVFLSEIINLLQARTYYVRAYATNAVGTSYGNTVDIFTSRFLLGDTVQGGVVAYILQPDDSGYVSSRTQGLIVAMEDLEDQSWGCYGDNIAGTQVFIGSGAQNTDLITAGCQTLESAAKACDNYEFGGYSDWYLPSRDELEVISQNANIIGNFQNKLYWTSTQITPNSAWVIDFVTKFEFGEIKTGKHAVRPIRSF